MNLAQCKPIDPVMLGQQYSQQGFISGIDILTADSAGQHRCAYEQAEAGHGKLHYLSKMHTLLTSPLQLACNPQVLDIVEQCIGPDILLFNTTYIVKEPGSQSHVSWQCLKNDARELSAH